MEKSLIIVHGAHPDGTKLRPSNWAERIASVFGTFERGKRLRFSNLVVPEMRNGDRVLSINEALKDIDPEGFGYIMAFAKRYNLKTEKVSEILSYGGTD